jgi:hypothetical protein
MTVVAQACEVIQPVDRDAFLHALAHRLRGEEIGDGSVSRAIRDLVSTRAYRLQQTVAVGRDSGTLRPSPAERRLTHGALLVRRQERAEPRGRGRKLPQ